MNRICQAEDCSNDISHRRKITKYCSKNCTTRQFEKNRRRKEFKNRKYKKCKYLTCHNDISKIHRARLFCSRKCSNQYYIDNNREKINKKAIKNYEKNKKYKRKIDRKSYRKNKNKIIERNKIRRHERRALGRISRGWEEKQFILQEGKCGNIYCRCDLIKLNLGGITVEHLIPITRGGTNAPDNLELWCVNCNSSKNNKTLKEYYEWKRKQ